jgi:hypothetical protein
MADNGASPPASSAATMSKIRAGEHLTSQESADFLAFSLVRIVEELEHICEALRLTPEEEAEG